MEYPEYKDLWIVSKIDGNDVTLTNFVALLTNTDIELIGHTTIRNMLLAGILEQDRVGDDGKKVTFDLGSMLSIKIKLDTYKTYKVHMANAGPNDEVGRALYEKALSKLGLNLREMN